ncbi:hypothetical protein ES708_17304 [subsurface metagenome]
MKKAEVRRVLIIGNETEISTRQVKVKPIKSWSQELKEWKEKVKKEKEAK